MSKGCPSPRNAVVKRCVFCDKLYYVSVHNTDKAYSCAYCSKKRKIDRARETKGWQFVVSPTVGM